MNPLTWLNAGAAWFTASGYKILLILLVTLLLIRLSRIINRRLFAAFHARKALVDLEFHKRTDTLSDVVQYMVIIVLFVTAGVMCLGVLDIEIAPILAAAGVLGIAVGFGAQGLVRDLIGGFFILLEDQVRVGDVVEIAGKAGVVERMNLKMTILRDLSGNVHFVPNGEIKVVTNMTKGYSRYVLNIGVAYREDVDEVMDVMRAVDADLRNDPEYGPDILEPIEVLGLDDFADSALIIKARITTRPIRQWRTGREYRRRLKKAFDARGIEIPFPHLTLWAGKGKDNESPPLSIQVEKKEPDFL